MILGIAEPVKFIVIMLKHLDLFSGIGGFSLGLEATGGFETVAFCDIDLYSRKVLKKHWPHVKQYKDIKGLNYERLKADGLFPIDIITGGYPCQPFSVAGRKKGEEDPRHLWPEMFRLIKELRPSWVIGENVSGHIKLGLDTVLENLESEDYSARTFSISASSVGANHKRERVWIVAHTKRKGLERLNKQSSSLSGKNKGVQLGNESSRETMENTRRILRGEQSEQDQRGVGRGPSKTKKWSHNTDQTSGSSERTQTVANSGSSRSETRLSEEGHRKEGHAEKFDNESNRYRGWKREDNWAVEPNVGRVADGISNRVDRLKCLGNSLVPQIPYHIGTIILEVMNGKTN